jgi:hypothetical protein
MARGQDNGTTILLGLIAKVVVGFFRVIADSIFTSN